MNKPDSLNIMKVCAVNLAILLVCCLLAEAALRVFNYPFRPQWEPTENALAQFDPELGWAYLPNLNRVVRFENTERPVFTDANGIRVAAAGQALSPTRPSILFVGCSYTMGHGLSYQESFVGQLAAFEGNPFQMVNLGVQAYGTDQALLALKRLAPRFTTKAVVYTYMDEHPERNGVYDRRLLMPDARMLGTKPLFETSGSGVRLARKALRYEEYRHSYLFDAVKITIGARLGLFPPRSDELTARLTAEMARYCSEHGIRFVVLDWRWDASRPTLSLPGIEVIDTLSQAPPGWSSLRIPGDNHPSAEAGMHAAHLLKNYLKANVSP